MLPSYSVIKVVSPPGLDYSHGLRSFAPFPRTFAIYVISPSRHLPLLISNNNQGHIYVLGAPRPVIFFLALLACATLTTIIHIPYFIIEQTIVYLSLVQWFMPFRVVCSDFSPVTYCLHMVTNRSCRCLVWRRTHFLRGVCVCAWGGGGGGWQRSMTNPSVEIQ